MKKECIPTGNKGVLQRAGKFKSHQIALITYPSVHLAMSSSLGAELDDEKVDDLSAGIDLSAEEDERPLSFTPPKGLGLSMASAFFLSV